MNDGYIYAKARMKMNGKTYVGAAIGLGNSKDELLKTEKEAIRNLLKKINNEKSNESIV